MRAGATPSASASTAIRRKCGTSLNKGPAMGKWDGDDDDFDAAARLLAPPDVPRRHRTRAAVGDADAGGLYPRIGPVRGGRLALAHPLRRAPAAGVPAAPAGASRDADAA